MRASARRRTERIFWVAGALLAGYCAGVYLEAHLYQAQASRSLVEALREPHRRAAGGLVGRLEIPRLNLSAMVLEGSDSSTLGVAVGHVPLTAEPGQRGNLVLSGHRDTFFRPLREIRSGDRITLTTPEGSYQYVVEWTSIVNPTDVTSLEPTAHRSLTLVTCYPFHYIGPAPQRFIVRARQS